MRIKIDTAMLKPFDFMIGTSESTSGDLTRMALGCDSTHNAAFIKHNIRGWVIGDTTPPASCIRPISYYEDLVLAGGYNVKVWRIKGLTDEERMDLCRFWQLHIDGLPYSELGMYRCWVFRFVNSLPWTIHGNWCSRTLGACCRGVLPIEKNPFRKREFPLKLKKNETPRTTENRLVRGLLKNVTDEVVKVLA